jgi:hypothetical protein
MGLPSNLGADGEQSGLMAGPNAPLHGIPPSSPETSLPTTESTPAAGLGSPSQPDQGTHYSGFALWLHRITVLMFVFVCASIGVLLLILPWRPEWTDNHLLLGNPGLRAFVANGFVRGICSGLGLLDIWIGFWEAVHYHEDSRP